MNRKDFLKTCGRLCVGATAASWLTACSTSNYYAQTQVRNNRVALRRSEFTSSESGKTLHRPYVLVRSEALPFPICVYRLDNNRYSAVLLECTHRSCELQPGGDFLICPCHGSEFSKTGAVQNPPAEQDLKTFPITQDEDYLYIEI